MHPPSTSTSACQSTSKNIDNINENVEANCGIEPIQISNSHFVTTIPLSTSKSTTTNNMASPSTNNSDGYDDKNNNNRGVHYRFELFLR